MSELPQGANRKLLLAYAEVSRDLVAPLRGAFEAAGFTVASCSDAQPPSNDAIDQAVTVIVCWTPAAVASDVVNLQAARASKARKLVSILLAPSAPPANLGRPLADLSGWRGDPTDREFLRLVHALHARLSGRMFSSDFWRSRYLSWGGLGAASLGAIAIIANLGDLSQTIDGLSNPAASQRDLDATKEKVEEVLSLLKQRSGQTLSSDAEAALRDSIEQLLSVQSGARGNAAQKLANGDLAGALGELRSVAAEGEAAIDSVAQTYEEIGALAFLTDTYAAMDAYQRANQLAPDNFHTLSQLGSLYLRTRQLDEAQETFEHLRLIAADEAAAAIALGHLGALASIRGDMDEAESYIRDALAINERNEDPLYQATDLVDLGAIMREKGQLADADVYLRRALDIFRTAGDTQGEAGALLGVGRLAEERNLIDDAKAAYARATSIFEATGDKEGLSVALNSLGVVAFHAGDIKTARDHFERSLQVSRDASAREGEAFALSMWGEIAELEGAKSEAIAFYRDAMTIYGQIGMPSLAAPFGDKLKRLGARPHPEGPEN
jgi:tetratricopeptide (TPR) repeat protein